MRHIFVFVKSSKIWKKGALKINGGFWRFIQADWTPLGNEMIVQLVKQQPTTYCYCTIFQSFEHCILRKIRPI